MCRPGAYWHPFTAPSPPARYSRDDLIIAFASTHDRLPIVMASRFWRQGVRTLIFMDEPLNATLAPPGLVDGIKANNEVYDHFIQPRAKKGTWSQPGDARSVSTQVCDSLVVHASMWILRNELGCWKALAAAGCAQRQGFMPCRNAFG